jgi:hypothetical protein
MAIYMNDAELECTCTIGQDIASILRLAFSNSRSSS